MAEYNDVGVARLGAKRGAHHLIKYFLMAIMASRARRPFCIGTKIGGVGGGLIEALKAAESPGS